MTLTRAKCSACGARAVFGLGPRVAHDDASLHSHLLMRLPKIITMSRSVLKFGELPDTGECADPLRFQFIGAEYWVRHWTLEVLRVTISTQDSGESVTGLGSDHSTSDAIIDTGNGAYDLIMPENIHRKFTQFLSSYGGQVELSVTLGNLSGPKSEISLTVRANSLDLMKRLGNMSITGGLKQWNVGYGILRDQYLVFDYSGMKMGMCNLKP